jgi:peptidoglycan/LPS O-acetylase OafA/YrhL
MGAERLAATFLLLAVAGTAWDLFVPDEWRFSRAFLPNKAQYFALGIASASWIDRRSIRSFVPVLAATMILSVAHGQADKLLPPLFWTLCLAAQLFPLRLAPVAMPLRWRPIQWLGAVSYPIYLANEPIHKVIGFVLARYANGDAMLFTALWLPAAALLPICAATLLHRYVEAPALRWGRTSARRSNERLLGRFSGNRYKAGKVHKGIRGFWRRMHVRPMPVPDLNPEPPQSTTPPEHR